MRKLAAAQEERHRQVVGLRESVLSYEAIAAQTGLSRAAVRSVIEQRCAVRLAVRAIDQLAGAVRARRRPLPELRAAAWRDRSLPAGRPLV